MLLVDRQAPSEHTTTSSSTKSLGQALRVSLVKPGAYLSESYDFMMPHKSLRQGRTLRTPAMALGLTDHSWSYGEYIWLPVHADPVLSKQMDERIARLLTPALQDQLRSRTHTPPVETIEENGKAAASLPKAA